MQREVDSINSISCLKNYGIEYIQNINIPYTKPVPIDTCINPSIVGKILTSPHYGCYLSHKTAIIDNFTNDDEIDCLLIFECDAKINIDIDKFVDKIYEAYEICIKYDLICFSFGWHNNTRIIEKNKNFYHIDGFFGAHAYMIPTKFKDIWIKELNQKPWHVFDLWICEYLNKYKMGIYDIPLTCQNEGISLLDNVFHNERI